MHMPNKWLLKKFFLKKRKKTQKCGRKKEKKNEKKKQKKTKDNTNTFYFYFSDFWAWDWRMFFVELFCWNCIAKNFVAQFDVRGNGTIVSENNLSSSMTNDFIVVG